MQSRGEGVKKVQEERMHKYKQVGGGGRRGEERKGRKRRPREERVLHFSGNVGLLLRRCGGQGPHAAKTMEPRGFFRVAAGFSIKNWK